MGCGLGKIQRTIFEILSTKGDDYLEDAVDGRYVRVRGWHSVGSVAYMVLYGLDCFERTDGVIHPTPPESQMQPIWRAIRTLEKRGVIESRSFPLTWRTRSNFGKIGGANRTKAIRLVQGRASLGYTINDNGIGSEALEGARGGGGPKDPGGGLT